MEAPKETVLYVVATPIGNLGDLSPRAIQAFKASDWIACEDTRVSRKLLQAHALDLPMLSYREANEADMSQVLLKKLQAGESVSLISDAGTPCISDPGFRLVRECHRHAIRVVPIPGPNAALTALMASGLPTDSFLFIGFLPNKSGARQRRLSAYLDFEATLVLYESCHRIAACMQDIVALFGPDRIICLAKELTKRHERILTGTAAMLHERIASQQISTKGEFVICIAKADFSL